jgi:DNA modification methylase
MKQIKTISIKCETSEKLEIAEMTEMQGGLKERTDIDYDKIKLSICKFGFSFPFFIWKSGNKNYLIDGHGRFATLCKMQKDGYIIPPLPVVYIQCKNKTEAKQKLLRLNSQYGKMTKESVLTFAEDIDLNFDEIALPDTVIDFTDATEPTEEIETSGDNDIPDVKKEADSKLGEMYELGNSILMCGSSTNAEDVNRLCAGIQAELLFTSPPYSDMRTYNGEKDLSVNNIVNFIRTYRDYARYMCVNLGLQRKEGAINPYWDEYTDTAKDVGLKMLAWNVWNKTMAGSIGMQQAMFPIEHEWIFIYGEKSKDINRTAEKRDKESIGKSKVTTLRNRDGTTRRGIKNCDDSQFKKMESVFECLPELSAIRSEHPAVFPVKLPEEYIKAMTKQNDYVIEPFGGSGTTLIACEKTNRKCRIMELDPIYCDVIRRRYTQWAKENGKPITSGCLE